jgi:glutathione synthase/RimK-type ligase-like ATP-grasp enzyme
MPILIVVTYPNKWPLRIPGVEIVSAKAYLLDPAYSELRGAKVFNLCRSYRYQSLGYYVSLIATARGHNPLPTVMTIQDMKSQRIIRYVSDELDELIQKSLDSIQTRKFTLSVYFGRNVAKKYNRLAQHLFNLFPAPLLRVHFVYNNKWLIQSIDPISASEISEEHLPFVMQVASEYFSGRRITIPKRIPPRYDIAILYNPGEPNPPSDNRAIQKFIKAAESLDMGAELITKEDSGRLLEYDALFIRETTSVNHYTYRLARRAAAEGLAVIDDPLSILRCTNKVYLAELLDHHQIPTPKTIIVHRDNIHSVLTELGLPCILKEPDSSFSQGVLKVEDRAALKIEVERMMEKSELIIAQEFLPTPFDWRVGILDRKPLFVCKYFMVGKHWQIIRRSRQGKVYEGQSETLPVEIAPKKVIKTALKAADLIGDGLYGVDLKEINGNVSLIEINDNPTIECGTEDYILKDELYLRIMEVFLKRIERAKERNNRT